jgi:hypothetical protein
MTGKHLMKTNVKFFLQQILQMLKCRNTSNATDMYQRTSICHNELIRQLCLEPIGRATVNMCKEPQDVLRRNEDIRHRVPKVARRIIWI